MKKLAGLLVLTIVLIAGIVSAGWNRDAGKTYWIASPTATTLWNRDAGDVLFPVLHPLVYEDTIRYLTTSNTVAYATGLWEVDSSGYYVPIASDNAIYAHRSVAGEIKGIQWEINVDGYIIPKD